MPETTPTAASAHLVTHEHGRAVDTHLHEPAPARMPITFEGDEPESPTPFDHMMDGARLVLLVLALVCTLLAAAGFFWA